MSLAAWRCRLLETDRWRPLAALVDRWYARPLSDDDGHAPADIEHAEQRLGVRIPGALVEWYELVGRRLRGVQDHPTSLDALALEGGYVRLWSENQAVWTLVTTLDAGEDPPCLVDDQTYACSDAPSSQVMLGMVVSETLVGAWAGRRVGVLGELRAAVRGGYLDEFDDTLPVRLRAAYAALDYVRNPFFDTPCRGDAATILRIQDAAIEWTTATDEAFAALAAVLGLAPA
jgi:hypothetical protein